MRPNRTRTFALAVAAALLAGLGLAASAQGGEYTVVQCENGVHRGHEADLGEFPNSTYNARNYCSVASEDFALKVRNLKNAFLGQRGEWRWRAPAGTRFVGLELGAKLRHDAGHRSYLTMATAAGEEVARVATGTSDPTGFKRYSWSASGHGQPQFAALLICKRAGGCPQSGTARTWLRNVRLRVRDTSSPSVIVGNSLAGVGWHRGAEDLELRVSDSGSGVRSLGIRVNGTNVMRPRSYGCSVISGTLTRRLQPCERVPPTEIHTVDTAVAPFRDGRNTLRACARDFGGGANEGCAQRAVWVDNTPPVLAFRNTQSANDPELIRAPVSDATSGVAGGRISFRRVGEETWRDLPTALGGGELRTRVDSTAEPPGEYEFLVAATDVAGNERVTGVRENGTRMLLRFPLKVPVRLRARLPGGQRRAIVPYRTPSKVSGRLIEGDGTPIRDAEVKVVERFHPGALIARRVRRVSTDSDGRYGSRLPGGPSRRVQVIYEGSRRHLEQETGRLGYLVRSKASLRTSKRRLRAGRRVVFRGGVKRYAARIPAGGKLVELQVNEGPKQWNTVGEARPTNGRGRFRIRYRFRRFYTQRTTFTFRIKVTREQGWPYKAPGRSRSRKVTILPRR